MPRISPELAKKSVDVIAHGIEVTPHNVEQWRNFVGDCRNSIVLGPLALTKIPELARQSEAQGLYVHAAEFWNEYSLIIDQYYKGVKEKIPDLPGKNLVQQKLVTELKKATDNANRIIQDHPDGNEMFDVAARQGLFTTKYLFASGEYAAAIPVLEESIKLTSQSSKRENAIELRGYLAEAKIHSGQIEEGVNIGLQTFADYDNDTDPSVSKIKNEEYDKWIQWRAGCILKVLEALLETNHFATLPEATRSRILDDLQLVYKDGVANTPQAFFIRQKQIENNWQRLKHI